MPAALVGVLLLLTLFFGYLASDARDNARGWDEPTAVVDGTVVELRNPPKYVDGKGAAVIRYSVGGSEYKLETGWIVGDHSVSRNDVLPIEYAVAQPDRARAVWVVESARAHLSGVVKAFGVCAALLLITGVGYLVAALRP